MSYFSGQGRVYLADVAAGVPGPWRYVGNAPTFNLSFETDVLEHKESFSGQRVTDLRLLREKTASLNLVLEEFEPKNLALALFGQDAIIAGSSVTDEPLAGGSTSVANGDFVRTAFPGISAVTVKDSDVGPSTLVEGTDYRIQSADHGTIEILDIGSYVQPFLVDYTHAEANNVIMLTEGLSEKWLKFDGLNTALNNRAVTIDLFRVAFDPLESLDFISDELAQMSLNGSALADDTKATDPLLGPFGTYRALTGN